MPVAAMRDRLVPGLIMPALGGLLAPVLTLALRETPFLLESDSEDLAPVSAAAEPESELDSCSEVCCFRFEFFVLLVFPLFFPIITWLRISLRVVGSAGFAPLVLSMKIISPGLFPPPPAVFLPVSYYINQLAWDHVKRKACVEQLSFVARENKRGLHTAFIRCCCGHGASLAALYHRLGFSGHAAIDGWELKMPNWDNNRWSCAATFQSVVPPDWGRLRLELPK